jgi:hypothetical protein
LLERPLHESPFPDPLARPTYRFCIPDSWLLRSPRPEAVSTLVLDGSAEPKDDDTTVKNGRSVAAAGEERPAPNSNGSGQGSGKRFSLFGSLLQTLNPAAAAGESESVAPSARPPPLKKRSGIDRMSVSEPVTGPSPIIEPSATVLGAVTDSNHEEVVEDDEDNDEHWQSIFVRPLPPLCVPQPASAPDTDLFSLLIGPLRHQIAGSSSAHQGYAGAEAQ